LRSVSAESLYRTGKSLSAQGDYVRAEQYLIAALARGAAEEKVLPVLLRACLEASRLRAAVGYAEPYLARHPDDWRLRYVLATVFSSLGEETQARDHLQRVMEDAPTFPDVFFTMGLMAQNELDFDSARKHFGKYLALAPQGPHAAEAREGLSRRPMQSLTRGRHKRRARL
jgi:tetratricopeptide (TPR) repeat protein